MTFAKLNGPIDNPRVIKARLTAEFNGIELELTPGFQVGVTTRDPEYIAKFPLAQSPGLETTDGFLLSQSAAIVFHIAQQKEDTTLLGKSKNELARIWQLLLYAESSLMQVIFSPALIGVPSDPKVEKDAWDEFHRHFTFLNDYIGNKKYLVGDTVSIADTNTVGILYGAYGFVLTAKERIKYANVARYFEEFLTLPQAKKVVTEFKFKE